MSNRMENLLIRGAHIVNPGKNEDYIGDIAVSNGKITAMGQIGELPGARVIEAKGTRALPKRKIFSPDAVLLRQAA